MLAEFVYGLKPKETFSAFGDQAVPGRYVLGRSRSHPLNLYAYQVLTPGHSITSKRSSSKSPAGLPSLTSFLCRISSLGYTITVWWKGPGSELRDSLNQS
jgi:hypothetical protein